MMLFKILMRLAARNTLRNRARTGLTVGMVVLGVALLIVAVGWVRGIFGQMLTMGTDISGHVRIVDQDFAERETLMPLYENIADVAKLRAEVESIEGVVEVIPRIITGATITVGEEIGDVFAPVTGSTLEFHERRLRAKENLASGRWFENPEQDLLIGKKTVDELGAKLGDEVVLLGMTQDGSLSPIKGTLVGITQGNGLLNRGVLLPLSRVQWLTDIEGGATELLIYTDSHEAGLELAKRLRASGKFADWNVAAWSERDPWASMMGTVEGVQGFIVFLIVFLAALGIWNTMMMSVLERTHEIGVLRAMGLGRIGTVGLFLTEGLAIGVVGGLIGVLLGAWPSWALATYGFNFGEELVDKMSADLPITSTIYGEFSFELIVYAFTLGLLMAVLGCVLPALRAASIQPVSAMRSGR